MRGRLLTFSLLFFDLCTAGLAWYLFYVYRIINVEKTELTYKGSFFWALLIVPIVWVFLYALQGTYRNVLRNYRLKTIKLTVFASLLGTVLIFFAFLLNDFVSSYQQYYTLFLVYLGLHFTLTIIPRLVAVSIHVFQVHKRKFGFNTIIIGGSGKAVEIYDDIQKLRKGSGHKMVGFININGEDTLLKDKLSYLGHIDNLDELLNKHKAEEVIIALESTDHERLKGIITKLAGHDVKISLVPDAYDILAGQVKMTNIFGALLIDANASFMPEWQYATKRMIDIVVSILALIILSPVYLLLAILVMSSSKGGIFFKQERIGHLRKPFNIFKYRTMVVNAEQNGPQLSSESDPRITKIGRFLRKTRLDEFPQFWNVLKGDMSLVGPRPERQHYIDLISKEDPQYLYLHKVRPGITSWGQVKFGYAENVEQMIERMKFDLLYIRNMTLALDFKIMFYTIAVMFRGKGK